MKGFLKKGSIQKRGGNTGSGGGGPGKGGKSSAEEALKNRLDF